MSQKAELSDKKVLEHRSFKEQQVGFIFSINGLRNANYEHIPESVMDTAYAVHFRAYELLDGSLQELAEWVVEDEAEPEIKYSPYELCDLCLEHDTSEDLVGFEFWLYSQRLLDDETIAAFKAEVRNRYEQAAAELNAVCTFLYAKTSLTEEVITSARLNES